jgi:Tol biopolymer transport system component
MRKGRTISLALVLALGLGITTSHPALAGVGTKQVSVTRRGGDPAGISGGYSSEATSISADGRYVAFASYAGDLVQGDHTRRFADIFVRDTLAGTTVRASVDTDGGDPDGHSTFPSISADGQYVAFRSNATDLVQGDGGPSSDVFVRDLVAGTTVRASVDTEGGDPDGQSGGYGLSINADGRYVAFSSSATDLIQGDGNGTEDIFVRDLVAGTTVRASVDTGGGDPDSYSYSPAMSADGRYVAFYSFASDLVQDDQNGYADVFVRDLVAGTTVRASIDAKDGDPDGVSFDPSINADGRYVAFTSEAPDLVAGDGNGTFDVFVRDLVAGTTVRASVDAGGGDPNRDSSDPSISADGRYVAFSSWAFDLVADDGNEIFDVFVRDLVAGTTVRASVDTGGGDPNAGSTAPSISAQGRYVAYWSYAGDLVPGPGDPSEDVFLARWS